MKAASILAVAALLLAPGCASLPPDRTESCIATAAMPRIEVDPESGEHSVEVSVLIYNVEGLPWPIRSGRTPQLREIARRLAEKRERGEGPDIVLLQEAFTREAALIPARAGYPNYVSGPRRRERASLPPARPDEALPGGRRRIGRGERGGPFLPSGLHIASEFPILERYTEPFGRRECAGFDCLANKGVMLARIWIPGVPRPLDIFNTHHNSRRSSGVSLERTHAAHHLQTDRSAAFIEEARDPNHPFIFGGDFNMQRSPGRAEHFFARTPYPIVHQYCIWNPGACDVRMSWDGDEPWMDTQDLQGFDDGDSVRVRPVRVEAMFDDPWQDGRPLADHDGFFVVYRLSWSGGGAEAVRPGRCYLTPPPASARPGSRPMRSG